jgi:hypothetical protein
MLGMTVLVSLSPRERAGVRVALNLELEKSE